MIVFLSDEIVEKVDWEEVGILMFLSASRGLPRMEIEKRFRGIMKVRNSMFQKKHQAFHIILLNFRVCCLPRIFSCNRDDTSWFILTSLLILLQFCFFLIGIHPIQGWTVIMRHGVTTKRSTKRLKHTGNLFRKNLQLKDVC